MTASYVFILGNSPQLSRDELTAVLASKQPTSPLTEIHPQLVSLQAKDLDLTWLQARLGGVVKIGKVLEPEGEVTEMIAADLLKQSAKRFSLLSFSQTSNLEAYSRDIKQQAKRQGLSTSYRLTTSPLESAASAGHQEYLLFDDQVARIETVQDIKAWSTRDFKRPFADPKSGMLPPKIARILINLASASLSPQATIYDPFCGSGTILAEAMVLGYQAIGSDISPQAVSNSQKNLAWLTQTFALEAKSHVFVADAHHVTRDQLPSQVEAVIFEGYLGPPTIRPDAIVKLVKGLGKLYLGFFKQARQWLVPEATVVAALPQFHHRNQIHTLDNLIDRLTDLGYTLKQSPLEYGREQAIVKRRIYVFQLN